MTMEQAAAQIRLPDTKARDAARRRLDTRAKLPGSLGLLEDAVIRLAGIQRTAFPRLDHKLVVVVCADNGVTAEGISPSAPTVTAAQAVNFARGGRHHQRFRPSAGRAGSCGGCGDRYTVHT